MKTVMIFLLSLCWMGANATIWRVNSNPQVNAHFTGINEANNHYTVSDGDTLYLENGSYFPNSTLTKALTLIGPGYFLLENDSTYANPLPVLVASMVVNSSSCKIIGVKVIGSISVHAPNNLIERCQVGGFDGNNGTNLTIRNCYITGMINGYYFLSCTMYNNIILGYISFTNGGGSQNIYNNTIYHNSTNSTYAVTAVNSTVINNIIIREPVSPDPGLNRAEYCINFSNSGNSSFARNVMSQSPNSSFPTNIYNTTKEDNFILAGSTDERWMLKTGSPAIGYGSNGDDCGAFGGPTYYVLSGLPWLLPRIIEANIPASGTGNVIPVHIKAKTQEE
jgi:hypothetical protein